MKRIAIFSFLVLIGPAVSDLYGMDAATYFNLGRTSTMTKIKIEYFTRALELNPTLAVAYEKRGMLNFFQEKYDHMIMDFQSFVTLVPNQAGAYRMLGVGYLKTGNYSAAISNLTRAIELDPGLAEAYANRAEAFLLTGKYEQAIRDATSVIRMGGDPVTVSEAYKTRYKTYWELGQENESLMDLRSAWQTDPRVWKIWKTEGGGFNYMGYTRKLGLFYVIGVAAAMLFKFKVKPPEK